MAKATAECTCKKCGAKFTKTSIQRNRTNADSWEQWAISFFDECPECIQKEREERASELAKEAEENGMPELQGSPKQITCAEQIRATYIENSSAYAEEFRAEIKRRADEGKESPETEINLSVFEATREYILKNISKSSWWIENRNELIYEMNRVYNNHRAEIDAMTNKIREV